MYLCSTSFTPRYEYDGAAAYMYSLTGTRRRSSLHTTDRSNGIAGTAASCTVGIWHAAHGKHRTVQAHGPFGYVQSWGMNHAAFIMSPNKPIVLAIQERACICFSMVLGAQRLIIRQGPEISQMGSFFVALGGVI